MKNQNLPLTAFLLATGIAFFCDQPVKAQNLIVNSNFATGDFTGWTTTETGSSGQPHDYGVGVKDGTQTVAYSGDTYGAYFNPSGGVMDLSQTVDITQAGTYLITCDVQPVANDPDVLTILLGGTQVFTTNYNSGHPYQEISVSVMASAGSQVIDFEFTPGNGPMYFDNAGLVESSAQAAPDGGTTAILLGSAVSLLTFFKRKLSQ